MDDLAHVLLVDAHAVSQGGHHDVRVVAQEQPAHEKQGGRWGGSGPQGGCWAARGEGASGWPFGL